MGLEASGKTSIVLCHFKKDKNLLSYFNLPATRRYKISEVNIDGKRVSLWDFGGQKQYREHYMVNMLEHLEETNELIYVVDIQDPDRYDESIGYFEDIIRNVKLMDAHPVLKLYLHKWDPNLEEERPDITETFAARLVQRFQEVAPSEIHSYKTTIFALFQLHPFEHDKFV